MTAIMTFWTTASRKNNDHYMGQLELKIKSSNLCDKLMARPEIKLPCLFSCLCDIWGYTSICQVEEAKAVSDSVSVFV